MAIHDLKDQIARLPEQPGVYLYANGAGETIYVGKARVLRDRVRSYLGARGADPKTDALLDEVDRPRRHRHRLGVRGAGAREQPDQAAVAEVQHPAARRQELPLPAADDRRGVSAPARGAAGREGRARLLRARSCPPGWPGGRSPCRTAVRPAIVQRGDHRPARPPVPRVRHQALPRALRRRDLQRRTTTPRRWPARACSSRGSATSSSTTSIARMQAAADGGALRAGGALARRRSAPSRRCATGSRRWRRRGSAIATRSA